MKDPFKRYRRQFRAWKNNRRLAREVQSYQAIFASRNLSLPDEITIRRTLKSRFPALQPKLKGRMKILAIYHHYNWENTSLKPALEKFGSTRHYDWFEEFNHQSRGWHRSLRARMNQDLVSRLRQWATHDSVDVIFSYLSGEIVTPEAVEQMRSLHVPTLNLALNDKEAFVGRIRSGQAMGSKDICRSFDLCWTSTEDALKKYCVEGALPIYLPEGANPEIHRPYDLPKTIDVSFIGQCYGDRPAIVRQLQHQGIHVETWGEGWPNGPLSTEEMVQLYSRSRINLGFGGIAGHKELFCLKGRDFEIPMSRGLYLTEYHPELQRAYDLQHEIVTYSGFDDLLAKIRYLLAHPEKAEEIRGKGYQRARQEHTWERRFEKLFNLMGLI